MAWWYICSGFRNPPRANDENEVAIVNYELHKIEGGRISKGNTAFL